MTKTALDRICDIKKTLEDGGAPTRDDAVFMLLLNYEVLGAIRARVEAALPSTKVDCDDIVSDIKSILLGPSEVVCSPGTTWFYSKLIKPSVAEVGIK